MRTYANDNAEKNAEEHSCNHNEQIEGILSQLDQLKQENLDLKNRWLRAEANLQNAQKAHQKEMEEARAYITEYTTSNIAMKIANISDIFAIAMHNDPKSDTFIEGVNMIYKSFLAMLEEIGISIIQPEEGALLDHYEHQVIGTKMTTSVPTNTVVSVLQPGYKIGKKVLRTARVIVSVQE